MVGRAREIRNQRKGNRLTNWIGSSISSGSGYADGWKGRLAHIISLRRSEFHDESSS